MKLKKGQFYSFGRVELYFFDEIIQQREMSTNADKSDIVESWRAIYGPKLKSPDIAIKTILYPSPRIVNKSQPHKPKS